MIKWMKSVLRTSIFLLITFLILPVHAEMSTQDLLELSLQELMQVKVSVASKHEESTRNAPASVTVISDQEIKQLGVQTLSELLNYVPGFQNYMSPHESNRSMILARGLSDIYGRSLLFMIDGKRINDEYTGGVTYGDHLISLKNIKQVEIIRGPGSALYGSNAFSGVINIITNKQNTAQATLGSNNSRGVFGAFNTKVSEFSLDGRINFHENHGESYQNLTDKNGSNKSSRDPQQVLEARMSVAYEKSKFMLDYMKTQLNQYYVIRRIDNKFNENNTQRLSLSLKHSFTLPEKWTADIQLHYLHHDRQQQTKLKPTDNYLYQDDWKQLTYEAQADFTYLTDSDHQLAFGTYLGHMSIPTAKNTFDERFVLDEQRNISSVYIQDQFYLVPDLRLTAGLRFDDYSDFGNAFTPRVTLHYETSHQNSIKFMYGRAFRAPSLGDLYDKEGIISSGNLFLKPVTVNTYELAFQHINKNASATMTWFFNDYHDFITTRLTNEGETVFDNVYDNHTQGLEFDINWEISPQWLLKTAYTYIISSNTKAPNSFLFSKPEQLAPKHYGNLVINYHREKWHWNLSTVWHDDISVLQDRGITMVFNSKLYYDFSSQWQVSANIRNLLDKEYFIPRNQALGLDDAGNLIQEMPARGREVIISAQYFW